MLIDNIKKAWDGIMDDTAKHIKLNKYLINKETMYETYRTALKGISLKDKIIIDYGCGGGWLGKYFQENNCNIKKYIGFDVSKKSISAAQKNNPDSDIIEIKENKVDFSKYNADIFISFFVMQHFPTIEYLNDFLDSLNNSNIKTIVLILRYAEKTKFSNDYTTFQGIRLSCWTNREYLSPKLTNYKFKFDSGEWGQSSCRLYVYKRIKND